MSSACYYCGQEPGSVPEWQPIETAPKDGTRVLIYAPGHLHMIGSYGSYGYVNGPFWWSNGGITHPTHWMPLPEFPAGVRRSVRRKVA